MIIKIILSAIFKIIHKFTLLIKNCIFTKIPTDNNCARGVVKAGYLKTKPKEVSFQTTEQGGPQSEIKCFQMKGIISAETQQVQNNRNAAFIFNKSYKQRGKSL